MNEIASIVRKVEISSTVPVWFHQFLASYNGEKDYRNRNLIMQVMQAAPRTAPRWRDERFVRFVIRQWLRYCVGPLEQYHFPWIEHPCTPSIVLPEGAVCR